MNVLKKQFTQNIDKIMPQLYLIPDLVDHVAQCN